MSYDDLMLSVASYGEWLNGETCVHNYYGDVMSCYGK